MVKFTDDIAQTKYQNGRSTDVSTAASDEEDRDIVNSGDEGHKKKRKHKDRKSKDGSLVRTAKKRRHSVSKPARDPRDEASPVRGDIGTRSPSPVIDFDGLSRPSLSPLPLAANFKTNCWPLRCWN